MTNVFSSYKEDDVMGRHKYDGGWAFGLQEGQGVMTFRSGDIYQGELKENVHHLYIKYIKCFLVLWWIFYYRGEFQENLPHGKGEFVYMNGDKEVAVWDKGQRHGLSRYKLMINYK